MASAHLGGDNIFSLALGILHHLINSFAGRN